MSAPGSHHGTAAGRFGGTLLSVMASIQSDDIMNTDILAGMGAVVSFVVSLGLKWITRRIRLGR